MLDLFHLRDQVGPFQHLGRSVAARQNQVQNGRLAVDHCQDLRQRHQAVMNGVKNFVKNNQVVLPAGNFFAGGGQGLLGRLPVRFEGILTGALDKALSHLANFKVRPQLLNGF